MKNVLKITFFLLTAIIIMELLVLINPNQILLLKKTNPNEINHNLDYLIKSINNYYKSKNDNIYLLTKGVGKIKAYQPSDKVIKSSPGFDIYNSSNQLILRYEPQENKPLSSNKFLIYKHNIENLLTKILNENAEYNLEYGLIFDLPNKKLSNIIIYELY